MAILRIAAVAAGKLSTRDKSIRDWVDSYRERIKRQYPNASFETEFVLGCSVEEAVQWIESKMQPGMTWENKKEKWYVKSIISAQVCKIGTAEGFYLYFNYTNMIPAWKRPRGFRADQEMTYCVDRDGEEV